MRAITLIPNLTEIAFWSGCGAQVIATDDFSNQPVEATRLPKVGGMQPSAERIARLRPTLIVGSSTLDQSGLATALRPLGVRFETIRTDRLRDIEPAARRIAALLGCAAPEPQLRQYRAALEAQKRARTRPPRVLYIAWPDPLYVAGHDTFADDLIQHVGGQNAVPATVKGWPQYSLESLLASPPDVIVFPTKAMTSEQFAATLRGHPVWGRLEAVRKGNFRVVDEDLFTRPGPRVPLVARELNAILDSVEQR